MEARERRRKVGKALCEERHVIKIVLHVYGTVVKFNEI